MPPHHTIIFYFKYIFSSFALPNKINFVVFSVKEIFVIFWPANSSSLQGNSSGTAETWSLDCASTMGLLLNGTGLARCCTLGVNPFRSRILFLDLVWDLLFCDCNLRYLLIQLIKKVIKYLKRIIFNILQRLSFRLNNFLDLWGFKYAITHITSFQKWKITNRKMFQHNQFISAGGTLAGYPRQFLEKSME